MINIYKNDDLPIIFMVILRFAMLNNQMVLIPLDTIKSH
jgi:hypothetical protein